MTQIIGLELYSTYGRNDEKAYAFTYGFRWLPRPGDTVEGPDNTTWTLDRLHWKSEGGCVGIVYKTGLVPAVR